MCIATGARISEVLGLQWKHVDFEHGAIRIEQRQWHQNVGKTKTPGSNRVCGVGNLVPRLKAKAAEEGGKAEAWVFPQAKHTSKPMWDSAVRAALHQAAQDAGCDFEGLGPHTMRRANISWRQAVGGSAIEASKIAGHTQLDTTMEYTFVALERQQETTRAIQKELRKAARAKRAKKAKQAKQVTAKPKKSPEPQLPPPPPLALPVPPVEQMPVVSTQVM